MVVPGGVVKVWVLRGDLLNSPVLLALVVVPGGIVPFTKILGLEEV